ncbi:uncharacterized protein LOC120846480 [Ixodes scapularis]|uniref:uncharacterized protein LOC120846480 n=1 Tax=Ixodes scapularis TaxID=6945 RepID=UPI001A9ECC6F|nr:uncharacterized protein LOC120846480 [Ixodes scapularis]
MTLRKWTANNEELQQQFNNDEPEIISEGKSLTPSKITKVLGMIWDKQNDCFMYKVESLLEFLTANLDNKRSILKAASGVFDPLRLIAPFVLMAKLLFQKLWLIGMNWDEVLPPELVNEWHAWTTDLVQLHSLKVPRYIRRGVLAGARKMQLHVFVDASMKAYGSCAYLRTEDYQGNVATTLVVAKTRVAPTRPLTVPRLELMGANMGSKLLQYIKDSYYDVDLDNIMWTDSTVALSWVRAGPEKWKPFVKNRVTEILAVTSPDHWRHCLGQDNPANFLTRGLTIYELRDSVIWWKGPNWLCQEPSKWPRNAAPLQITSQPEVEKETQVLLENDRAVPTLFDAGAYNNFQKVLRITAWVIRFANNANKKNDKFRGTLSAAELDTAERYWVKQVQKESFETDILLRKNGTMEVNPSLAQFHPFF